MCACSAVIKILRETLSFIVKFQVSAPTLSTPHAGKRRGC